MMDYLLLKSGRFSPEVIGNSYYPTSKDTPEYALLKEASISISNVENRATHFPNISYIMVKGDGHKVNYYTMITNRFYEYVIHMKLQESKGLGVGWDPKRDTLTIFPEISVNYPRKIYVVNENRLAQFIQSMKSVSSREDFLKFDKQYGLQKLSPNFWETIDQVQEYFIKLDIIHNGSLDLRDYGVHDLIAPH